MLLILLEYKLSFEKSTSSPYSVLSFANKTFIFQRHTIPICIYCNHLPPSVILNFSFGFYINFIFPHTALSSYTKKHSFATFPLSTSTLTLLQKVFLRHIHSFFLSCTRITMPLFLFITFPSLPLFPLFLLLLFLLRLFSRN